MADGAIRSDLGALRVEARPVAAKWSYICKDLMGIDLRITETRRSLQRQTALVAAGASNSNTPIGWHNVGLAWDFAVFLNGVYQKDDKSGLYRRCGLIGMALGCRWGGNWNGDNVLMEVKENDLDHLEYHPGVTLEQFLAAHPEEVPRAGPTV